MARTHRVQIAGRDFNLPADIRALRETATRGADAMAVTLMAATRGNFQCPTEVAFTALEYGLERAGATDIPALLESHPKPSELYAAGLGYLMSLLSGAKDDGARPNGEGPSS